MKKGIALIAALVLSVLLLGCEEAVTYATADDAKAALNGQGVITIDGDFSEPNQASDIRVNNGFAGFMRETGLINGKWTISANYEEWFYAKYVTGEPVNHQEGVNSGSTLGFYDMDGNCLGYAQERDFTPTGLYASEDCKTLWDDSETVLAEGNIDWSYSSDMCTVTITPTGGKDVPIFAKIAMYVKLYYEANMLKM